MNEQQRLSVFQAQTTNVRELERAWGHVNRQINTLIIKKDDNGVKIATKLLGLIYCALAEAIFSKLIHTPYGLELAHIEQVKTAATGQGIKHGWLKCAELAIQRVNGAKSNHGHNVLKKLSALIEAYIFDPSLVRNKLAHGQWSIALNRENTAVNLDITKEIEDHSVIELYRRKHALEKLAAIVEDIIESPNKAHHRDYWPHLIDLENKQQELAKMTLEIKVAQLFKKKSYEKSCVNTPP